MKISLLLFLLFLTFINFMYIKNSKIKIIVELLLIVLSVLVIGTKYQCYATDDISTEVVYIDTYEFNEENDIIKISYKDLDDEEVVKELSSDEIQMQISDGNGVVQFNKRTFIKDIVIFNKFTIKLGEISKNEDPIYLINIMNFMSESEIENMIESLNTNN